MIFEREAIKQRDVDCIRRGIVGNNTKMLIMTRSVITRDLDGVIGVLTRRDECLYAFPYGARWRRPIKEKATRRRQHLCGPFPWELS